MSDPLKAIEHSQNIAPETVSIDHVPESEWAWYTCETEKITASWNAIEKNQIKRRKKYRADQYFKNYDELKNKLSVLGEESLNRISKFKSRTDIIIPMPYGIVLL